MGIKFGELEFGEIAKRQLLDALEKNWVSGGPKVKEFEKKWGEIFDYKYNIAVSSGTDAGINACLALYDFGAERGDEIIVPACAFASVGNAVVLAGFKPVFVDIERHTLNINPDLIEKAITPKTRAIKAVHTMGKPCEMDKIVALAKKHNLLLFEDSCEAHGAKYKDTFIGQFGDAAFFSYYAAHLICSGEGGMISSNNEKLAKVVASTRTHGRKDAAIYFDHVRTGLNSKMNDMEAALGLEGVELFWKVFNTRKDNLYYILKKVEDLKEFAYFNLEEEHEVVCPHAFSILLKDPKYDVVALSKFLNDRDIQTKRTFGSMPTQHGAFAFLGHKLGEFPEAEYVGDNGIHIGIHQFIPQEELDKLSDALHEYFSKF